jgi:tetrahydromethanopterin S-methyltransferase subunit C
MSSAIYLIFIPFVFIGSVMAYLITYNEYLHHYQTKKEPRKLALQAAVFTFVVFGIIMIVAIYVLTNFIEK